MNNTQLYLSIGIPTITVILAWLSNRADTNALRGEMNGLRADLIRMGENLNAKIDRLAEQQHRDTLMLMGQMVPLHDRMAIIETKQK